jgi:hypothetical protein
MKTDRRRNMPSEPEPRQPQVLNPGQVRFGRHASLLYVMVGEGRPSTSL